MWMLEQFLGFLHDGANVPEVHSSALKKRYEADFHQIGEAEREPLSNPTQLVVNNRWRLPSRVTLNPAPDLLFGRTYQVRPFRDRVDAGFKQVGTGHDPTQVPP